MKGKMPNFAFRIMAHVAMPIRNRLMPPGKIFAEFDIQPGHQVLDYGCGPGMFSIMAAQHTGPAGKVYALDIHPLALKMVSKKATKNNLSNVSTILSSTHTGLGDNNMDRIICLDVLHVLEQPTEVLAELHRVLKPGGFFYLSDHHMKDDHIASLLESTGLFSLAGKGERSFWYTK
jgi:ubiquinone/menaquinone biosynthesis C-methylase UbiE